MHYLLFILRSNSLLLLVGIASLSLYLKFYGLHLEYRKTLDRRPRPLSVEIVLTLGPVSRKWSYVGPGFYQIILQLLIFAANALAYGSYYCICLTLL